MKKIKQQISIILLLIAFLGFKIQAVNAQATSNCFEIQSILVAACGTPEGENEMVRFIVGPNPLPLVLLTVSWPNANNNFLGITQNAQTASNVAAINSSISNCGFVQEPVGGVLPANSTVILVTSVNMNPAFNSFAGLTDTVIMIFQTAGNTSGHFKNYGTTPPLTRKLVMAFDACADSVTYYIDSLTMQNGTIGDENGATVVFDTLGNATYINPGCEAPFGSLYATLSADSTHACAGDSIHVIAAISNTNYTSFFWTGGAGTFANPASLTTTYQTSNTFQGVDALVFGIVGNCNDTVIDTLHILINCAVGIKENNVENNISVLPNPVADECSIVAKGFTNSILSIYDVTGRVLLKQKFNEQATIDLDDLKAGIYMMTIQSSDKKTVAKLVKE